MNKKVFIYCTGIDEVLSGSSKVAGIQVQMSFWARTLVSNGCKVMAFTNRDHFYNIEGIRLVRRFSSNFFSKLRLEVLVDIINCRRCIIKHKPNVVIVRGASRVLWFLSRLCNKRNIRLVFFSASDSDFIPSKEIIGGNSINRKLYQKSIGVIDCFITQNVAQHDSLKLNYGKESVIIPNIWIPSRKMELEKKYDAIWIANLRPLKRVEWFVELARKLPCYHFAIVGGGGDQNYYRLIKTNVQTITNVDFLGAQPLQKVNELLAESKLLVCTSEFEGFPNTFLQAWALSVPVVSTVNPNDSIINYGLGSVVSNRQQLIGEVSRLLNDQKAYYQCQQNIDSYFIRHHDAEVAYKKLLNMLVTSEKINHK